MILPFGKFNRKRLDEVPLWYLEWLVEQPWLPQKFPLLADAVAQRLDAMADDQTTALATDVLKTWRRDVLKRWHPDRAGGSHAAFVAVSDAIETLSAMLTQQGAA